MISLFNMNTGVAAQVTTNTNKSKSQEQDHREGNTSKHRDCGNTGMEETRRQDSGPLHKTTPEDAEKFICCLIDS
jgi:hypothetical protein